MLSFCESKTVFKQVKVQVTSPVWINGKPREIGWEGFCAEWDAQTMQSIGRVKIISEATFIS